MAAEVASAEEGIQCRSGREPFAAAHVDTVAAASGILPDATITMKARAPFHRRARQLQG